MVQEVKHFSFYVCNVWQSYVWSLIMTTITMRIVNCLSDHKTWSWITVAQSCQWTKSWDHSINIHSSQSIALSFILKLPSYALIIDLPGGFSTIILNLFLNLPIPAARWDHSLPDVTILSLLDDLYMQCSCLLYNILLINCSVPSCYFGFCPAYFYVKRLVGLSLMRLSLAFIQKNTKNYCLLYI